MVVGSGIGTSMMVVVKRTANCFGLFSEGNGISYNWDKIGDRLHKLKRPLSGPGRLGGKRSAKGGHSATVASVDTRPKSAPDPFPPPGSDDDEPNLASAGAEGRRASPAPKEGRSNSVLSSAEHTGVDREQRRRSRRSSRSMSRSSSFFDNKENTAVNNKDGMGTLITRKEWRRRRTGKDNANVDDGEDEASGGKSEHGRGVSLEMTEEEKKKWGITESEEEMMMPRLSLSGRGGDEPPKDTKRKRRRKKQPSRDQSGDEFGESRGHRTSGEREAPEDGDRARDRDEEGRRLRGGFDSETDLARTLGAELDKVLDADRRHTKRAERRVSKKVFGSDNALKVLDNNAFKVEDVSPRLDVSDSMRRKFFGMRVARNGTTDVRSVWNFDSEELLDDDAAYADGARTPGTPTSKIQELEQGEFGADSVTRSVSRGRRSARHSFDGGAREESRGREESRRGSGRSRSRSRGRELLSSGDGTRRSNRGASRIVPDEMLVEQVL